MQGAWKWGQVPHVFARPPRGVGSFSEKSELNTGMPGDSKKQKSKVPSSLAGCGALLLMMTLCRRNPTAKERPNLTGWLLCHLLKHVLLWDRSRKLCLCEWEAGFDSQKVDSRFRSEFYFPLVTRGSRPGQQV